MSEENNNAKMSEAESPADGNKELSEHARDLGPRHEVRGVGRSLARGHGHHTLRQAGTDGELAAGPVRVFLQALHAQRQETLAPAENFFRGDRHAGGDLLVRLARGRKQHDASRSATRTGRDRLRAWDSNRVLSSELNVMTGAIRIRKCLLPS
jgi:hypothetical protein